MSKAGYCSSGVDRKYERAVLFSESESLRISIAEGAQE
jgi:hypothetical protein